MNTEEKNCLLSIMPRLSLTSLVPRTIVCLCALYVTTKGRKRAQLISLLSPSLAISCEFRQNRKQQHLPTSLGCSGGTGQGNSPGTHTSPTGDCSADDRDDFALGVTSEPLYFTMESVSVHFRLFIDIGKHLQLTATWKTSLQNRC